MKILICGIDGYIGWPLALHLQELGHEIRGLDNYSRRWRIDELQSQSVTPTASILTRMEILNFKMSEINLVSGQYRLENLLEKFQPDAIIHLAEQPSAPWSMMDRWKCNDTHTNNVIGTLNLLWAMKEYCPEAHLVKLGTMGEYGTPNCDISEGEIPLQPCAWTAKDLYPSWPKRKCPMSGLPFPRQANSFYHLTKVHDTHNIIFACKNWGLRSTDIMQGVVFGLNETNNPELLTRFDYDECFGTVINRFCAQAIIGHPLTVYGKGGQTRGFLPLKDSIQCITLIIENPPSSGEYRTFNQFENVYTVNQLAKDVCWAAKTLDLDVTIDHIKNPRNEAEQHYYNPAHQKLFDLGYVPTKNIELEIVKLIKTLLPYKDRISKRLIMPKTSWR